MNKQKSVKLKGTVVLKQLSNPKKGNKCIVAEGVIATVNGIELNGLVEVTHQDNKFGYYHSLNVKQLVVEEIKVSKYGDVIDVKSYPLKHSQWKYAINEIGKEVEFVEKNGFAKILPKKEVIEAEAQKIYNYICEIEFLVKEELNRLRSNTARGKGYISACNDIKDAIKNRYSINKH